MKEWWPAEALTQQCTCILHSDTPRYLKNCLIILFRGINEHATSPAFRNKLNTQLEEVTRRLAAAFNDVHQLCLQEIEKSQQVQAQQIEQEAMEEAEEVD